MKGEIQGDMIIWGNAANGGDKILNWGVLKFDGNGDNSAGKNGGKRFTL